MPVSNKSAEPVLNTYQVMSAGLAGAAAAFVTSRFGVAGTLLGAALTTMIITGGSAILRAYIESASSRIREVRVSEVPSRLRSWGERRKAGRPDEPDTLPGRPDLRANFVGRMRAALDWFANLPVLQRRSILTKGLVAAAFAFVICMVAVWGVEKVIGNSLSCGLWARCPVGAAPGFHPAGFDSTGTGSSITGGDVGTAGDAGGGLSPAGIFDGGKDAPIVGGEPGVGQPDSGKDAPIVGGESGGRQPGGGQPDGGQPDSGRDAPIVGGLPGIGEPDRGQSAPPDSNAARDSNAAPDPNVAPDPNAGPDPSAAPNSNASQAPDQEPDPSSASPAAQPEGDPSSASPAADQ